MYSPYLRSREPGERVAETSKKGPRAGRSQFFICTSLDRSIDRGELSLSMRDAGSFRHVARDRPGNRLSLRLLR